MPRSKPYETDDPEWWAVGVKSNHVIEVNLNYIAHLYATVQMENIGLCYDTVYDEVKGDVPHLTIYMKDNVDPRNIIEGQFRLREACPTKIDFTKIDSWDAFTSP